VTDVRLDDPAVCERRWDASVELVLERQIGLNWCWAAVAKGIVEHHGGPTREQCRYATHYLRQRESCCGRTVPELRCDAAHDVDSVLQDCGVYAPPPFHRPVTLATLCRELEHDRPVVALMRFPATVHAVAITAVDVANRHIGFCDPWLDPRRADMHADAFTRAYNKTGRWFYTILTRPPAAVAPRPTVSLLRDRFLPDPRRAPYMPHRSSEPLEIDLYEADVERLADGTGLDTAERSMRYAFRLDAAAAERADASLRLDVELSALRDDVEARLERGFEVRIVRCFAIKLEALWFTDPADVSHRTDHYVPLPPLPYYLEAGREYGAAELRDVLAKAAHACLPSVEINRRFVERVARESAHRVDDPTV
jgi:Papain-like cysteine protease AvrRpt2